MVASEDRVHGGKLTKVDRYGWKVQDKPGEALLLAKHVLEFDDSYQRTKTASEPKILRIAANWSWIACGCILIGFRNGRYYVIDGHHRVRAAMRRSDIETLPCLVFQTESAKQEAEGFIRHARERKALTSVDTFNALITAEDKTAIEVKRLIDDSGRVVSKSSSGAKAIKCIGVLMNYAKTDMETLRRVWPLTCEVAEGHPFNERVIMAFMYIEQHMPDGQSLLDRRWAERLKRIGQRGVLEASARAAAFYAAGGPKVFAHGVVEAMNKGLHQKLELVT